MPRGILFNSLRSLFFKLGYCRNSLPRFCAYATMDSMISRLTLFSLLLSLMLGIGIYTYSQGEHDRCSAYPAGGAQPKSEYVITGERQVEVPCSEWFLRQPIAVQILFVVDMLLPAVFAVNALADLDRWLRLRRANKRG